MEQNISSRRRERDGLELSFLTTSRWWRGVPTKLIRKTALVQPSCPIHSDSYKTASRLAVYTLTFEIPQGFEFSGRACAHKEIRMDVGDMIRIVIPNYRPKSYSLSDLRPEQNQMDVTIKIYPNGRATRVLNELKVGDRIHTFGMHSDFSRNPGKFLGCIANGVSLTEIIPIIESELTKGKVQKVVILWANRTSEDIFWHEKTTLLRRMYPTKFELVHIFSREHSTNLSVLHGNIDTEVIQNVFRPRIEQAKVDHFDVRFLVRGTKEMVRLSEFMLTKIGFPMPRHQLLQQMN